MSWPGPRSLPLLRDWLLSTLTAHLRASSNGHYSKEPRFRETWCSGQSSRLAPRQPHLLLRTPFSLLLPLVGAGPSDLLLRNRRCQKQWECYLCKYVTKARCASTSLSPPALMNQAARTTRHRTEVRVHLKSQQGAEVPPPGYLTDPRNKPPSPALQADTLLLNQQGSPINLSLSLNPSINLSIHLRPIGSATLENLH